MAGGRGEGHAGCLGGPEALSLAGGAFRGPGIWGHLWTEFRVSRVIPATSPTLHSRGSLLPLGSAWGLTEAGPKGRAGAAWVERRLAKCVQGSEERGSAGCSGNCIQRAKGGSGGAKSA